MPEPQPWHEIAPKDAVNITLPHPDVTDAPRNENGEVCPWPWEPQQLVNGPLGQYRCPYCGAMVMASMPHIDYGEDFWREVENFEAERPAADPTGDPR